LVRAGRLGTKAVVTAEPDGKTLLFAPNAPVAIYPHSYPMLEYDPVRDLSPIATFDVALAVSSKTDVKNIQELIIWAKANPSQANYGSPGVGGLGHFFAVLVALSAGVDLKHVSYRGSGAVDRPTRRTDSNGCDSAWGCSGNASAWQGARACNLGRRAFATCA
jgi:tripartite-type tricarboxylate transporter receptor subunit TctC